MSLRLRLIVAFFLLSVVPLAAVTLFTYASNARAMREAAGREAELLAGELTQRMQVVTAQLSERVERLMDVAEARAEADGCERRTRERQSRRAGNDRYLRTGRRQHMASQEAQVAQALGEMAMLLENVELRGLRGPRPPGAPAHRLPAGRGRFRRPPPPGAPVPRRRRLPASAGRSTPSASGCDHQCAVPAARPHQRRPAMRACVHPRPGAEPPPATVPLPWRRANVARRRTLSARIVPIAVPPPFKAASAEAKRHPIRSPRLAIA